MKKLIFFVVLLLISCSPTPVSSVENLYCPPSSVSKALDKIQSNYSIFLDEVKIADNAPRVTLPQIITNLQSIRRDAENIDVPQCMDTMKEYLINLDNTVIDAYIAFLGGAEADTSQTEIAIQNFLDEMERLENCMPNCEP